MLRPVIAAALAAFCLSAGLSAQPDSATVAAGPKYAAGPLHRLLWGGGYRDLWTRPVRVEVLDPDTFAGGVTPLRVGGDFASNTLHLRGADGVRYVFRSVNKDVSKGLGPEFEGTLVEWVVQDQIAASHPGAPVAAHPLLQAAGILHPRPRLMVMADRASLGACRALFAGMLGTLEVRPDENEPEDDEDADTASASGAGEGDIEETCGFDDPGPRGDSPAFAGADKVKNTDNFLDDLEESPRDRLDAREYLAARLVDVWLGDWDRHEDQWRWARFDADDGARVWRPVPRDRDYVFVDHEGLLLELGRKVFIRLLEFEAELPDVSGATVQAEPLDRRLLSALPAATWDSVAAALRARLTDGVIDAAIDALPPEYRDARYGIAARLRSRREQLPAFARTFFRRLAVNVDVHTTDADETAVLERHPDGSLTVRVTGEDDGREWPVFERRFDPSQTDDVRLFLHGGDDRAVVRGAGTGVGVRVIGGGGDDVLADSSRRGGVAFYDDRGDNRLTGGPRTRISREAWTAPVDSSTLTGQRTYRDWGSSTSLVSPWVDWARGAGPVVGGGPKQTAYGFRRVPHAWQAWLRAGWAPLENRWQVELLADLHPEMAHRWYSTRLRATDLENVRFYGFGNDTDNPLERGAYDTWLRQVSAEAAVHVPFLRDAVLSLGPVARWTDPELEAGSPLRLLRPVGADALGQAGAFAEAEVDRRDVPGFPRRGWRLEAGGSAYPVVWGDGGGPFGEAHAAAAAYLSAGSGPVLALRAGGKRVWGEFPFHEAAFLGGGSTLRGHTGQRFAGDAMVFGGAEARVPLFRFNPGVRGTFGVLGLADAGRVWYDGTSEGGWHTAVGGGAFFTAYGQTATVTVARGERTSLNLSLGVPF